MRKVFIPNQRVHKSDEQFVRNQFKQKHEDKEKRRSEKYKELEIHYRGLLSDMIANAMSQITPELSPEDIENICAAGEKAWKTICSNVRATNNVIRLSNDTFRNNLIMALKEKYPEADQQKTESND